MGHVGARKGAGRKAGSLTIKTRAIAEQAVAEGITPLEVMLRAMRSSTLAIWWPLRHSPRTPRHTCIRGWRRSNKADQMGGALTTEVVYRWKREDE
jgi:hypothetical protein